MIEAPRLDWARAFHLSTKGLPLDFDRYKYLLDLYRDDHREIVIQKATQIGVTEWAINELLCYCSLGHAVFYVLPTQTIRNEFVKNRIDKTIYAVPYYQELVNRAAGPSDEVGMKHIGAGVVRFVGSNSFAEFGEFPADVVIIDEYDRCDKENLPYARDRLGASDIKAYRALGNPTVQGRGIAQLYDDSDQRTWQIKCEHCGRWQEIDWFKNVLREIGDNDFELIDREWSEASQLDVRVYCDGCKKPIDRLANGKWVARYPGRPVHGYHLSRLISPMTTIAALYTEWLKALTNETLKQRFFNSELGLSYASTGAKLTQILLDRCILDYQLPSSSNGPCTMGVDVGALLHVRISELDGKKRKGVYIGTVRDFNQLDTLIKTYAVRTCVIDAMPETREARALAYRHPGRVLLCQYPKAPQVASAKDRPDDFYMKIDYKARTVNVDRTQSLDSSHSAILMQENILPANAASLEGYYDQMCAPTRIYDETAERFIWTKHDPRTGSTIPDHHRHADNYDHIAARISRSARDLIR